MILKQEGVSRVGMQRAPMDIQEYVASGGSSINCSFRRDQSCEVSNGHVIYLGLDLPSGHTAHAHWYRRWSSKDHIRRR